MKTNKTKRPKEEELDSTIIQATTNFINDPVNRKLKNKLKDICPEHQFEYIINNSELCRNFCLYLIGTVSMFVHHPGIISVNQNLN